METMATYLLSAGYRSHTEGISTGAGFTDAALRSPGEPIADRRRSLGTCSVGRRLPFVARPATALPLDEYRDLSRAWATPPRSTSVWPLMTARCWRGSSPGDSAGDTSMSRDLVGRAHALRTDAPRRRSARVVLGGKVNGYRGARCPELPRYSLADPAGRHSSASTSAGVASAGSRSRPRSKPWNLVKLAVIDPPRCRIGIGHAAFSAYRVDALNKRLRPTMKTARWQRRPSRWPC